MADPNTNNGSSAVAIVALVLLFVIGALFFVYGLPAMQGGRADDSGSSASIDVDVPLGDDNGGDSGNSGQN